MTVPTMASLLRILPRRVSRPAALRLARWSALALALVVLPLANAGAMHFGRIWSWDYYGGHDILRTQSFALENEMLALAERAAYLQGEGDERPAYRWGAGTDGTVGAFVETSRGYLPMAEREFLAGQGRTVGIGLVENATSAIVMSVTNVRRSECHRLENWLSAYTAGRASVAEVGRLGRGSEAREAVSGATWMPFAKAVEGCREWRDGMHTILIRFDGPRPG